MNNIVLNMTKQSWDTADTVDLERQERWEQYLPFNEKKALEASTSAEFPTEHNSKRKYVSYASLPNMIPGGGGCGAW